MASSLKVKNHHLIVVKKWPPFNLLGRNITRIIRENREKVKIMEA